MKLISLNTWCGKVFAPLIDFVSEQSKDTDIFCFQEITTNSANVEETSDFRSNLLNDLKKVLPEFDNYFSSMISGYDTHGDKVDFDLKEGLAIFVNKKHKINEKKDFEILHKRNTHRLRKNFSNMPIVLQVATLDISGKPLNILNFHGISRPGDKLDSSKRLIQSRKLKKIINQVDGEIILAGDFNLMPWTQSIKIIEGDLRNLIKEFDIQDTRGKINRTKGFPDEQKFADFTFVSKDIKINSFTVPDVGVSDHLPMILEFNF